MHVVSGKCLYKCRQVVRFETLMVQNNHYDGLFGVFIIAYILCMLYGFDRNEKRGMITIRGILLTSR